ncbi:precorrin-2 C(20)-methyltransferase [Lachnospiraceae bacterium 47-T17]
MKGILYGIGVGPGDPELLTLKAVRIIEESAVCAVPGADVEKTAAYRIAVQAVPGLREKKLLPVPMPMVMDKREQQRYHEEGAKQIEAYLVRGESVAFLTLGDPTVYSTFSYIRDLVERDGCETETVAGITSFCAAAARLNMSLAKWNEPLHIIPAAHRPDIRLEEPGNYILMKSGSKLGQVKELLRKSRREVAMVENCGMEQERIYRSLEEIPDDAGYYSLIIVGKRREDDD